MASSVKAVFDDRAIGALLEELFDVRSKWHYLGLQLQLSLSDLSEIKEANKDDTTGCLLELLKRWVQTENATCESLLKALRSKTMNSHAVAEQIQAKFQMQQSIPESTTQGLEASGSENSGEETVRQKRLLFDSDAPPTPKRRRAEMHVPDSFDQTDFIRNQPPDRLCIMCCRVPLKPQRSNCCNRLYCKPCAEKFKKCSNTHHSELIEYKHDKELGTKISKLTVKCPNWKQGCEWKGEVFRLRGHISECSNEKLNAETDGNEETVEISVKTNFIGHLPPSFSNEDFARKQPDEYLCIKCKRIPSTPLRSECCPYSALYCETCCPKNTPCPTHNQIPNFKCDVNLKSSLMGYRIRCPYNCGWKDKLYKLKQHLPKHTAGNSELTEAKSTDEQATTPMEVISEDQKQDQIHSTNGTTEDNDEQSILNSSSTDDSLIVQVNALSILNYQLQAKLESIQQEHEACGPRMPPLTFHIPSLSSYQTPCLPWKSLSFYTHQLGYRVNLLVQVEATGALWIGLAPELGVNDEHLRWPVSGRMEIELLNQNADSDHTIVTPKFKLQNSSTAADQPTPTIKLKMVRIPTATGTSYTSGDSLYFRLLDIKLEEDAKPWLLS